MEVTLVVENGIVKKRYLGLVRVPDVESHVDLTSLGIAIPGAIDMHVHLRGLELSEKEDERSGTMAAARGGITAVIDMPNTKPEVRSLEVLKEKLSSLNEKSVVDYGIFVGLPETVEELVRMVSVEGVAGLKLYPQDLARVRGQLIEVLSKRRILVVVHAEHPKLVREGCSAGSRHICRPIEAELAAISLIARWIERAELRVHVTHVTNSATLMYAKSIGASVDTCPQYLYLSNEDEAALGCIAKVNPPLRPREVVEDLRRCIDILDAMTTDHAPHTIHEKCQDFDECPPGIASADIALQLTLNMVSKGLMFLDDVVRLWNEGPSRIVGLERWGCIDEGCVASYTLVNLKREVVVDPQRFYSKCKLSPYAGRKLVGDVVATIVRGRIVYLDGEFYEIKGSKALSVERDAR